MYATCAGKDRLSQMGKYCSNEWKARLIERYLRSLGFTGGSVWIGFSIDERHRMCSFDPSARWHHEYPLIDRRMSRGDCIALATRMGWPSPPRSACWMCPYRTDAEWRHLKVTDPGDFDLAVGFERQARGIDPILYLHRSSVPLDRVDLNVAQTDLLADQCGSGMCFA